MTVIASFPLSLENPGSFGPVREFLRAASYDDATVRRVLGMESMCDLGEVRWDEVQREELDPALNLCIDLFLLCDQVPAERFLEACGEDAAEALRALGLVRAVRTDPDRVVSPVWLYPVDGFVVASDRRSDPDDDPYERIEDIVFPAIHAGALRFLDLLPDAAGGEALDLCGGAGAGAFRLSRTARSTVIADLAPRAARFAEFNARLNGLDVESLTGDLYEPVAGRKFDVIVAHPPYVPAAGPTLTYRDGGGTGEEVTRGIVLGLPAHLKPGGRCAILCMGCDSAEGPFEQRVRGWLGEARDEFDVVFGHESTYTVDDVIGMIEKRDEAVSDEEIGAFRERLAEAGTVQLVYGVLRIDRFAAASPLEPLRVELSPQQTAADLEAIVASRRLPPEPGPAD